MEKIINILEALHPAVDFKSKTDLVDGGVLDSFDIIALVNDLSDTFNVDIDVEYLEPENFNSVAAIGKLLEKLGAKL